MTESHHNMEYSSPKISAILPNYNSSAFLPRSIESLLKQQEAFNEIMIVDDGSTDDSISLIESFMRQHPHIRLIKHEKNQGVIAALNTGIQHAVGDYVILCAADDLYAHNIVALAKQVIMQYPSVGIICGDAIVHRFDLKSPFYRMLPYPVHRFISSNEFKSLSKRSYVGFNGGGGLFINKNCIQEAGMLHPATRWHGDWLLYFFSALKQGIYYINEVFIQINIRENGYSEGRKNTKIQNQVMLDTLKIVYQYYPELWNDFKSAALVPDHAFRYILLFLFHPISRRFITMRFIWKMIINSKLVIRIGRLFPYRIILSMRKFLRA